ncbi:MAG: hypothetical protein HND48_10950 [Chloroflexi bacterium]|nr:hypothetical protein [Chloroflexota bacterium]
MSAIQAANGIQDASRIFAGQDLIIPDARTSSAVSALPDGIATIDLTPLVLTEGKSARLLITSAAPATVNVTFLNRVIPVSSSDGGVAHRAFPACSARHGAGNLRHHRVGGRYHRTLGSAAVQCASHVGRLRTAVYYAAGQQGAAARARRRG